METERANDLKAFREFADAKLSNSGRSLILEEALDLWEHENSLLLGAFPAPSDSTHAY
jgi:hypothetical protein